MSRKAGVITINLNAGTAQFMNDMDQAQAKVRNFGSGGGSAMRQFGDHTVSSMQASSAAIRTFEGNLPIRAVERFVGQFLGLGPILQKAFPVLGGFLFGEMIVETGKKVYEFFKQMQDGPEKTKAAFRGMNAGLETTNDQLRVTNDRLSIEIAKLEGRHENNLKLELDEGRLAADHLAESLNKAFAELNQLLAKNNVGFFDRLMGVGQTTDIKKLMGGESGMGGVAGRVAEILDEGNRKIAAAKDLNQAAAARTEAMTAANKELAAALAEVNKKIAEREALQRAGR